jgi:hypothetical protein
MEFTNGGARRGRKCFLPDLTRALPRLERRFLYSFCAGQLRTSVGGARGSLDADRWKNSAGMKTVDGCRTTL